MLAKKGREEGRKEKQIKQEGLALRIKTIFRTRMKSSNMENEKNIKIRIHKLTSLCEN